MNPKGAKSIATKLLPISYCLLEPVAGYSSVRILCFP
jgi:hypothetical protein